MSTTADLQVGVAIAVAIVAITGFGGFGASVLTASASASAAYAPAVLASLCHAASPASTITPACPPFAANAATSGGGEVRVPVPKDRAEPSLPPVLIAMRPVWAPLHSAADADVLKSQLLTHAMWLTLLLISLLSKTGD